MSHTAFKIHEIVNRAVSHDWSVPEFQRGFVWKPQQVRDLADSLWLDYPVGSILIWDSTSQRNPPEPRGARDGGNTNLWLVDGQQRTTALCILSGRKPYWWADIQEWNETLHRYDVRFDIEARDPPFFVAASAAVRASKTNRYTPVRQLITLDLNKEDDRSKLRDLAKSIKQDGLCAGMDAMEVYTRLERVQRIRDREIVAVNVSHDLEQVVDIFGRLNSKGTRVRETDIYLGVVAARDAGWVRESFMPFLDRLEDSGFDVTPNLLFQSVAAIGTNRVRFKEIDESFWTKAKIGPAWKVTQVAWQHLVDWLAEYGVMSVSMLPSQSPLIPSSVLFSRFPNANRDLAFEWLLQALRYGRYSGASHTAIEEDIREIDRAVSATEAIAGMRSKIRAIEKFDPEFFMRDYSDKFGKLVLYLLIFRNSALDWDGSSRRIAFDGDKLVSGFEPQFHHVFPRKFLKGVSEESLVEALSNIAIIGANTNLKISAKNPLDYFEKYGIGADRRKQQYIEGDVENMTPANFPDWLRRRAGLFAQEIDRFMNELRPE